MNRRLKTKYLILREVVIWLGLFEYIGLGGGLFFAGRGEAQPSAVLFLLMGLSFYISTKLAYYVQELLIRLATSGKRT